MNWLSKNFLEFMANLLGGSLDFFSDWLTTLFDKDMELMTSSELTAAVSVTKGFSITLVILMAFKQYWSTYVMETDGDPDSDPLQILVKLSVVLAMIEGNEFIFTTLQTVSRKFAHDITGAVSTKEFISNMDKTIGDFVFTGLLVQIPAVTLLIVIFGMLIAFGIKVGIRAGELALMRILFPVFAVDKIGTNPERWNAFLTSYVVTFFGYSIQLFCLQLGLGRIAGAMAGNTFTNYFAGLVFFWLALKTPKWLEKFVYSSGIGQMAANGARTASFMLPSILMRRG